MTAPKFGTSGLRGLSSALVGRTSSLYATAFARHLLEAGLAQPGSTVLIGRDYRPSSPEIAENCAAALLRAGLQPVDCGTLPTPALADYGLWLGAASLMITGSHIPADRNGIKFYRPDGEIDKADEQAITLLAHTLADDALATKAERSTAPDQSAIAATRFLERNKSVLPPHALRGLKVGVYQHSSVGRDLLVDLLTFYGAETIVLGRSEQFIPVDTEAVSEKTCRDLKAWSKEYGLDAIISTDGDADRPLVADENGMPLRGDLMGLLTAKFLRAGVVVTPVTSNSAIEGALTAEVVRTKVGSPFVIAGMTSALRTGKPGVMGFEANGGLLLASDFATPGGAVTALPTRDCFLPILAVLFEAVQLSVTLSTLVAQQQLAVALSDRLEDYDLSRSSALMAHLRASNANLTAFLAPIGVPDSQSDIDGLRVTLTDGTIIHLRPSGNAPEMRCYVEAPTQEAAEALMAKGLIALGGWQAQITAATTLRNF